MFRALILRHRIHWQVELRLHIQPHRTTMGLLFVLTSTRSVYRCHDAQSKFASTFIKGPRMRADTRTFQAIFEGLAITVDPDLTNKPSPRAGLEAVSVCARCSEEIFSPVTWAHLRGETLAQPIPDVDSDTSDFHIAVALNSVVRMFNARPNPKKRGPMVDFRITAKELLKSSQESCGFCKLLIKLDIDGRLSAQPDETTFLRLQAFWPEKVNGSTHPTMLEVGWHPNMSGGGETCQLTFFDERGMYMVSPLKVRSLKVQQQQRTRRWMQMT